MSLSIGVPHVLPLFLFICLFSPILFFVVVLFY